MRAAVLFAALVLGGCIADEPAPPASEPKIVYEETLTLASAADDRSVPIVVSEGFSSLTVLVSGRNAMGTGSNARIELFDPTGRGGGHCFCGGGAATDGGSSFGSGGRPSGAQGTWTLEIDALGKAAIHVRVRANPTGGG